MNAPESSRFGVPDGVGPLASNHPWRIYALPSGGYAGALDAFGAVGGAEGFPDGRDGGPVIAPAGDLRIRVDPVKFPRLFPRVGHPRAGMGAGDILEPVNAPARIL